MKDIFVLASFTIDKIIIKGRKYTQWGGPAFYAVLPPVVLNLPVYLFGSYGKDFPWKIPKFPGRLIQTDVSIVFEHTYENSTRKSRIISYPKPVNIEIPRIFSVGFINPVFNEFTLNTIRKAMKRARIVGIDIQGFIRKVKNGNVVLEKDERVLEILQNADIVKMDLTEFNVVKKFLGKVCLITLAEKGAIAKKDQEFLYIPTYYVEGDPTGTGDVFLSAFLIKFSETRDIAKALAFANAFASILVEGKIFTRKEKDISEVFKKLKKDTAHIIKLVNERTELLLGKKKRFTSIKDAIRYAYVFQSNTQ